MKIFLAVTLMLGLAATSHAQSCCAEKNAAAHEGCAMGTASLSSNCSSHSGMQTPSQASGPVKVFAEPVQSVYDNYLTVQSALASDSLKGVSAAAAAMAKAIQSDSAKVLSAKVAEQAETLAKAKDLGSARDAFKDLSESLIRHLSTQKNMTGIYHVAYCPMAKASWIQTSKTVINPYMGPSMVHCGELKT